MAAKIRVVITETAVNVAANSSTITIKVQYYGNGASYNLNNPSGSVTVNGTKRTFSHDFTKSKAWQTLYTKTGVSIPHNADGSKTINYSASFKTGVSLGTLKTSGTVTLSKITRTWSVTYDANGGTGAPVQQTKAYGVTLVLSQQTPTKTGHRFVKWNTAANGSGTSYYPGGAYTGNAALVLYAIWEPTYVAPTIDELSAYRITHGGNESDYNEEGTDVCVTFAYTPAKHYENGQWVDVQATPTIKTKVGQTELSGASPVHTTSGAFSASQEYPVTLDISYTLENETYRATRQTFISMAAFTVDINENGTAVAFGRSAPDQTGNNWKGIFLANVNGGTDLTAAMAAKGLAGKSLEEVIAYILNNM